MRNSSKNTEGIIRSGDALRKYQLTLLVILDEVIRICKKHKITWFLSAGSALGAVRHSGFIPWDDDIDVAMPREDYEKFLKVALDELDDKFFLDCYETNNYHYTGHSKVRLNNTTYVSKFGDNEIRHNGLWVDIFPLDYNKNKDSKKVWIAAHLSRDILEVVVVRTKIRRFKTIRHKLISLPFFLFTNHFNQRLINKLYQSDNKHKNNFSMYSNIYYYKKDIYPVSWVTPPKKIKFEGRDCYVYHDVDKYLTQLYGDYMTLPPKEERVCPHDLMKVDYDNGVVLNSKEEYNKLHKHNKRK